jgi:RimJ/RimL family protein N-acetyltransferase
MSLVMPSPARATGNPAHVRFAPLAAADLALMHAWLNAPHVVAGYSRVHTTPEDVAAKYGPRIAGTDPISSYIASVAGRPLGYVQTYRVADFTDYAATVGEYSDAVAIDVLIGEVEYTGRGLGPRIIAAAVAELVFPQSSAECCIATPRADNTASLRAFAKAGFALVRSIRTADGDVEMLMARNRDAARES